MYTPKSETVYFIDMMDDRYWETPKTSTPTTLDGIISDALGVTYKGQQTGDMLSNDTDHTIEMITDEDIAEYLYVDPNRPGPYVNAYEPSDIMYFDFASWIAAKDNFERDFQHERAAPSWQCALAWCIDKELLPRGKYVVRVSW